MGQGGADRLPARAVTGVWPGPEVADGGSPVCRSLWRSLAILMVVGRHDGRFIWQQGDERGDPLGVQVVLPEHGFVDVPEGSVAGWPLLLDGHASDLHGQLPFGYARGFFDEISVWRPGDIKCHPAETRAILMAEGGGGVGELGGPVDAERGVEAVQAHWALVDQADEIGHGCEK